MRTFEAATRLPNGHPRDTEEAQYNLAFPVAAALLDGEVGPGQVLPPRLHDPELLALLDRVSTEVAPEFEAEFPAKAPAEVIVETHGDNFPIRPHRSPVGTAGHPAHGWRLGSQIPLARRAGAGR